MNHSETDSALKTAVRSAYSRIADEPHGQHAIAVGRDLALGLGYPAGLLDQLPSGAVQSFAGVSNVHRLATISSSDVVLDLGCGAGMDSLIAATSAASVVGVDFSQPMLDRARLAAERAGVENVRFILGDAEAIGLPDSSVDVALVNGIFNLNPSRERIFSELARVIKSGGRAYAAELIVQDGHEPAASASSADWFA